MAKVKSKVAKAKKTGTHAAGNIPKTVIKRYNTLMKTATAFGKLIGAV